MGSPICPAPSFSRSEASTHMVAQAGARDDSANESGAFSGGSGLSRRFTHQAPDALAIAKIHRIEHREQFDPQAWYFGPLVVEVPSSTAPFSPHHCRAGSDVSWPPAGWPQSVRAGEYPQLLSQTNADPAGSGAMNGIKVRCGSSSFVVKLTFISLPGGFRISGAP